MRTRARVLGPGDRVYELEPGDVIGRVPSAVLHIDDPRVSEAHCMVSLREGELRLLGLRGAFAVGGKRCREVVLEPGLVVQLAQGVALQVQEVTLPEAVLGVAGPGLPAQALPSVCSLLVDPQPRLVARFVAEAPVQIWSAADGWRVRAGSEDARRLGVGDVLDVGGHSFEAVAVPLRAASRAATRGAFDAPLRIVAYYDSVHLHRDGQLVVALSGVLARMVSELASLGAPISWQGLCSLLWPDEAGPHVLRSRLDTTLTRLRGKLRGACVRTDLVRPDGAGLIELVLYPADVLEDRT